jgi:hypothetical protein
MFFSLYKQQQPSAKATSIPVMWNKTTEAKLKTTAKQISTTLVKVAFIADPLLWPVLQAGLDQLKGMVQLIRSVNN